ncbi:hypothetical protein KR074_005743 [Drosophila pseudoananassae]|nr:hypothetical protein KR074_005743 [Drosophila pseudoananassae]
MAGKRQATSNLNHDNWDHEEEPEERGTFRTATEDELKTRVIKKARRKVAGASVSASSTAAETGEEDSPKPKSVFSGFSGFGKPATSTAAAGSPFAFLAKIPKASTDTAATSPPSAPTFSFLPSSTSVGDKPAAKSAPESAFPKPTTSIFSSSSVSSTETIPKASTSIFGTSWAEGAIPKLSPSIFGNTAAEKKESVKSPISLKTPATSSSSSSSSSGSKPGNASVSSEFRESVAELNRAIMKFLKEHMDKNPYVILTPVFKHYDKHLKDLRSEDSAAANATKPTPSTPPTVPKLPTLPSFSPPPVAPAAAPTFSLGTETRDVAASTAKPAATFSFGKPNTPIGGTSTLFAKKPNCTVTSGGTTTTTTTPLFAASTSTSSFVGFGSVPEARSEAKADDAIKPGYFSFGTSKKDEPVSSPPKTNGFSFGLKADEKPSGSLFTGFGKPSEGASPSTGFSFTPGSTPFSFGNIQPPAAAPSAAAGAGEDAEESEEPPKVEFTQVVEDGAVYSKRCKVFVKKDKDYTDRGVGTLYLKPVKDSGKTQMLVRADTNLGNILVNLILSDGIPCQRMGKNNVMMVCIPTPEEKKATTLLLRVKTSEEADELLKEVQKHIK